MNEWKIVTSSQFEKPKEVDTESSPMTVYLRRNIKEIILPGDNEALGSTGWEYEERLLTREEYDAQQAELESPATQMIMQTLSAIELRQEMMEV